MRENKLGEDGKPLLHVKYMKFKEGEATVRQVKKNQNYGEFLIVNLEVTGKQYTFQKLKITCYLSCVTLYWL